MVTSPELQSTGLLLSGGIDSAVLLAQLLKCGWRVVPFYVQTGCAWQASEHVALERFLDRVAQPALSELVTLAMPLADLYGDHWSITGARVPDDHTTDDAVYLVGRNPLLLIKPALWCVDNGIENLALGTLAGNPFHDATPNFFHAFEDMVRESIDANINIARPFERLSKLQVLEMGRGLPLEFTFSCLSPVKGMHCGHCNKCAERRRAFHDAGYDDGTVYASHPPLSVHSPALR